MKKIAILIGFLVITLFTNRIYAQDNSNPNVQTIVNIQKDDDGNIISYDSTYVETWSSDGSNVNVDSLMQQFNFNHDIFNDNLFFKSLDSSMSNNFFSFPDINKEIEHMRKLFQGFEFFENDEKDAVNGSAISL